jgi:hypothetical protein
MISNDSIIENTGNNYRAGMHYINGWLFIKSIDPFPPRESHPLYPPYPYRNLYRYYTFPNQDSIFLENKRLTINMYYFWIVDGGYRYQYVFSSDSGLVGYTYYDYSYFGFETTEEYHLSSIQNDIKEPKKKPDNFNISQNFPNPFNPSTTIRYYIPSLSQVSVIIYDLLGNELVRLVDKQYQQGEYSITWNGKDRFGYNLSSGVYLYKIEHGMNLSIKKMNLIK